MVTDPCRASGAEKGQMRSVQHSLPVQRRAAEAHPHGSPAEAPVRLHVLPAALQDQVASNQALHDHPQTPVPGSACFTPARPHSPRVNAENIVPGPGERRPSRARMHHKFSA
ncbi:hypothetical protein FGB62_264g01 [Gracilaria domingensis]|nr:hypothetical protein FGB62_264g01 [Gracilaria domingensis]